MVSELSQKTRYSLPLQQKQYFVHVVRIHLDLRIRAVRNRLRRDLGWQPQENFDTGLRKTVRWYLDNRWWWEPIWSQRYPGARLGTGRAAAPAAVDA